MRKYTAKHSHIPVKWNDKVFMKMFFHYVRTICYEVVFCVCIKREGGVTYEGTVSRWCKVYIWKLRVVEWMDSMW